MSSYLRKNREQSYIEKTPTTPVAQPRPIYQKCIAILTANINGQRIAFKAVTVSTMREIFQVKGRRFLIDPSKAFMISRKGLWLMYDWNITEPLDKQVDGPILHKPVQLGDSVHYSKHVDLIMQGTLIQQLVRSLGQPSQLNLMAIMLMLVGVVLGYFIGSAAPFKMVTTTTPAKIMFDSLRWWIR